jgi:hypothetical protein
VSALLIIALVIVAAVLFMGWVLGKSAAIADEGMARARRGVPRHPSKSEFVEWDIFEEEQVR